MADNQINTLNYADYDFNMLVQQLIERVKLNDSWKDTYRSSTGQMLIELYAYVGNMILYYVERRASESYLTTARLKSSIMNIVSLLNYLPKRKTSATGKLRFTLAAPYTKKIFIPRYTECQTATAFKYVVSEDVVLLPGVTSIDANAIQGYKQEIQFTASGALNAEFRIEDTNVENKNLFVYVNGELWSSVSSFVGSVNTSKHYRVRQEIDDSLTIIFGNNIFGKAPLAGQTILVRYIVSDGLAGNVYEADKITTINSVIYDEDASPMTLAVTNPDLFLGGDDAEDIEEIRSEAPKVFKTGDRAVTKDDYVSLLLNFPGVASANAWGENEEIPPNYDMFNRVKLVVLLQDWQLPNNDFKQKLANYLYTKAQVTVKYEYVNPVIIDVIPTLSIKASRNSTLSFVQSEVETAIASQFVLGTTTTLGVAKRFSDVVAVVEAVQGVTYHHMVLDIRKDLLSPYDSYYFYGTVLDARPVRRQSVRVCVGAQILAVDDGAGGFTSIVSGITVTGVVNYSTGVCAVNVSPVPGSGDEVYVRYQQEENGDIVVTANQICKLYATEVVSISYA